MAKMFEREWDQERQAQRDADRRSYVIIAVILLGYTIVDSLSTLTEAARDGESMPMAWPWLLNLSSVGVLMALAPVLMWVTSRAPVTPGSWRWAVPVHVLVSLGVSAIHITAMVAIRKALWPPLFEQDYTFFSTLGGDILYEYRKDAFTYLGFVFLIQSSREYEQSRLEARAAREDARREKRLTLKCGGRTLWIEAHDLISAKAAGNYIEVTTETGEHLARNSLSTLARQLEAAGVRAARVHRSHLVNLDKVVETKPTGSGDLTIRMNNGGEIPGSRRFRGVLNGE